MFIIFIFLMLFTTSVYADDVVKVNDTPILTITNIDKLILANDLLDVNVEISRRLKWVIDDKVNNCFFRMYAEWVTNGKLEKLGVTSIPTKRDDLVALIIARPEYKNRIQRDKEMIII